MQKRYVFCFVFDPRGKVLVLKRADFMRARPNEWDLPGGGLDDGEEHENGMRREILEETGLIVDRLELVIRKSAEWRGDIQEFSYYRANSIDGDVTLSIEHTEYEWHEPLIAATMVEFMPHKHGFVEEQKTNS